VASQLKQLEELVQELEEGLEDARRGESEARGEDEFLRGEVERTRAELRREREHPGSPRSPQGVNGMNGAHGFTAKDMEQKEDEIRGLKAIIHSLSRDSVPSDSADLTPTQRPGSFFANGKPESLDDRLAREKLEHELADLRATLESKTSREEELERQVETLRRGSVITARGNERSSIRDSRGTVVLAPHSPPSHHRKVSGGGGLAQHHMLARLDTMPESDSYSTATENSTLWCEICETNGHDILTCSNMFGTETGGVDNGAKTGRDVVREGLKPLGGAAGRPHDDAFVKPAPLLPLKATTAMAPPPPPPPHDAVRILPNPMDGGPVAGKETGFVDPSKWCAVCERDGHDSVDCPFEDAF
jgi:hypothetical protein